MTAAFASTCLVAAAIVVGWPVRSRRARQRRLALPASHGPTAWLEATRRVVPDRHADRRTLPGRLAERGTWPAVAAFAAAVGLLSAGPVAALLAAGYGGMAVRWLGRRERRRAAALVRARVLDSLGSLTAELRAGLPPSPSTASIVDDPADPLSARAAAAVSLAESTGAPLADLLDRIEADARAAGRAAAAVEAQSAGARATALLLAGLPIGGIALGYAIGADPLRVLLHTPVGAACALGALALQAAGLAWSARLAAPAVA